VLGLIGVVTYTTMGCLPPGIVTKTISTGMGQDCLFNHEHGFLKPLVNGFYCSLITANNVFVLAPKSLLTV